MKNPLAALLQQAQELQEKLKELQSELERLEVEGEAGAGLVKVRLTGNGTVQSVQIDPSLLKPEERELLQELLAAAFNEAQNRIRALKEERFSELASALPLGLGGLNFPL